MKSGLDAEPLFLQVDMLNQEFTVLEIFRQELSPAQQKNWSHFIVVELDSSCLLKGWLTHGPRGFGHCTVEPYMVNNCCKVMTKIYVHT